MSETDLWLLDAATPTGRRKMLPADGGAINGGFQELQEAHFVTTNIGGKCLLVDDAPTTLESRNNCDVWLWQPGFFAGTVEARVLVGDEKSGTRYLFDVTPDPNKLGQDTFDSMVQETWAFDPDMMLSTEPATMELGDFGDRHSPHVRYARIAKYAQPLSLAIAAILRDPHRTLRSTRVRVAATRVRMIDRITANVALASSAAALFFDSDLVNAEGFMEAEPLFNVPLSEPTFDTAANRTLGVLLANLVISIQNTRECLQEAIAKQQQENTRTGLKERWPRRKALLDELEMTIRRALRSEPFRSLPRRELSAAGLTAIMSHPVYARAQNLLWRMIRPGYEHGQSSERAWMSPTWGIYEAWCFVAIVNCFREKRPDLNWKRSAEGASGFAYVGSKDDLTIEIRYQQNFQYPTTLPTSGFWSVSAQLVPDIVLVIKQGTKSRWIVTDAKYRQKRTNVLDAMRSAHIYRDALRLANMPPNLSVLLVPAFVENASWLHTKNYQESHGVGALVMSPKQNAAGDLLETLLVLVGDSSED